MGNRNNNWEGSRRDRDLACVGDGAKTLRLFARLNLWNRNFLEIQDIVHHKSHRVLETYD
jgi:hypothetical protein